MTDFIDDQLIAYYEFVKDAGKLLTNEHARNWSDGVLKTLGTSLDRKTKKDLAKKLPQELSNSLTSVFWLLHFRDPNQTWEEFLQQVARRSGNSNAEFARYPTQAVFGGLKSFIDGEIEQDIVKALSPELRRFWEEAKPLTMVTKTS